MWTNREMKKAQTYCGILAGWYAECEWVDGVSVYANRTSGVIGVRIHVNGKVTGEQMRKIPINIEGYDVFVTLEPPPDSKE